MRRAFPLAPQGNAQAVSERWGSPEPWDLSHSHAKFHFLFLPLFIFKGRPLHGHHPLTL